MQQQTYGPVHAALDGIVFRAMLSFVGVAVITAAPLLLPLPPGVHQVAHAVLPASLAAYAFIAWLRERNRPPVETDPWPMAVQIDPGGAQVARLAVAGLPIGWLAAMLGLLMHHLNTQGGAGQVFAVDFPVLAVAWILARMAWHSSTRRVLTNLLSFPAPPANAGNLPARKG